MKHVISPVFDESLVNDIQLMILAFALLLFSASFIYGVATLYPAVKEIVALIHTAIKERK